MNNTKEERQALFLFCVLEPVKVLLRCNFIVGRAIVAFFRPHIHYKPDGEEVKVSNGDPLILLA